MGISRAVSLCRALALCLCASASLFAQFETASVLGSVRDSSGASLPSARVSLENVATGVRQETLTDQQGDFIFFNVRIGSYQVRAESKGFKPALAERFTVTVGARQRVDLTLQVGDTTETVTVSGAASALETDSSDRGQVVTTQQIVNLPLNGRSYADLALLAPGVRRSVLNNQSVTSRDASFNVNGLRSSLNNFMVDGVDNNAYGTSNQGFSNQVVQLNPDAVAEFKVQTNNYSAEYGRAGGAIINASVRSGTNGFHGAAWEFLRNTELNAVGFFRPTGNVKPVFQQNQFGAAIGGPIKKDKMFFFADYEGLRRVSRQLTLAVIPTLDQRNGILGVAVRNPITGKDYPNGIIPQADIAQFARVSLSDLPAPNRIPSGTADNFESLPRGTINDNKGDVRYDHYFGTKVTAFVRYSHRLANIFEPPAIPGASGGASNGNTRILNQQIAPGFTYTINPTSLVEFRIGISKTEGGKTPIGLGLPTDRYGIPNIPSDPRFVGGIPSQTIGGYTSLGRQNSNPQFQNPFVVNPKVNYSKSLRRHNLKAGYEYQNITTDIDDFNPKYGQFNYNSRFSRPAGVTSNDNIYNLADYLFGLPNNYQLNNAAIVTLLQRMHFGYIQDDWKVSDRLTLNLGVRYEFGTPQWEKNNLLANFDPATNTLIQAKSGSLYDRTLVHPDRNNWAPRVGLAYRVLNGTVVRSGYGISYIHFNRMGGENLLAYNGPNIVGVNIDQTPGQGACTGDNFRNCFRTTSQGFAPNLAVPANYNPLIARVNYIPSDYRTSYVQTWHFTVQQELTHNLVLDVAYVGNRGNGLMILADYNQAQPNLSNGSLGAQARRPLQAYSLIQEAFGGGFSTYHSLQTKLEKRYSNGLVFLNSFTWSKAMDNAAGHLEANNGDNSRVNIRNLPLEKGLSNYNQPLNNVTSVVWEVPFGRGRHWGNTINPVVQGVLGGWRLTGINTAGSGLPINVTYNATSAFQVSNGGYLSQRPNYVAGNSLYASNSSNPLQYLNRAAFAAPTDPSQPFGNLGRNVARGPEFWQLDLGLHKDFPLWSETRRLEFRAEAFNLLNRTNFQLPNSDVSNSTAFGIINSAYPPRQLQLGLKLVF